MQLYHHLADVAQIADFYESLFNWRLQPLGQNPWPSFSLQTAEGFELARVEEAPEAIRGRYAYWMPCFGVQDLAAFRAGLAQVNGDVTHAFDDGRLMVADCQQASFMVQPI